MREAGEDEFTAFGAWGRIFAVYLPFRKEAVIGNRSPWECMGNTEVSAKISALRPSYFCFSKVPSVYQPI